MAYNLDFSGWKDMRKAQADSVLNQGTISANLIAHKNQNLKKLISGFGGLAVKVIDDINQPLKTYETGMQTGLIPDNMDEIADPMQFLSANNLLSGDEKKDQEMVALLKKLAAQRNI